MKAGRLKYRIELLKPTFVVDQFGSKTSTWEPTRIVAAERVKNTGRLSDEVGEHFADYSVQFNIRDAHPIAEGWRIRQIGGYLYTVTNILPNLDRGFNTLCCERVNE